MAKTLIVLSWLLAAATADVAVDQAFPEDCADEECALSLRQLRGESTLAAVAAHRGAEDPAAAEATPAPAEATKEESPATAESAEEPKPAAAEEESPATAETAEAPKPATEEAPAPEIPAEDTPVEEPTAEAAADAEVPTKNDGPAEVPAKEDAPAEEAPAAEKPADADATEAPAATEEAPAEAPAATEEAPAEAPAATEEAPAEAPAEEKPADADAAEAPAATEETPAETDGLPSSIEEPAEEPAPVAEAPETPAAAEDDKWGNMTQEAWEEKQGGLCCYSGEDPHNTCGTCYATAIASFKTPCAKDWHSCSTCGGSWCEPKCVMGAADPNNKCNTAFETGTAAKDSFCGKSATTCASCKGEWCRGGVKKVAPKVEGTVSSENAASSVGGFCCYRGNVFAKNMCGACEDVSHDTACANLAGCSKCGGTWCPGPRCIKAFKDKMDPCNSAYAPDSVASPDEYCAGSEEHCDSCHGAWCNAYNISFATGEKYDPNKPLKISHEDDEDIDDMEDESDPDAANSETADQIANLFPDGLAKGTK